MHVFEPAYISTYFCKNMYIFLLPIAYFLTFAFTALVWLEETSSRNKSNFVHL